MPSTFKQLPVDFLVNSWKSKLPPNVAQAYVEMARTIAERDLNLLTLFNELMANFITVSTSTFVPTNVTPTLALDASAATLAQVRNVLGTLITTLQGTGIIQ